MDKSVDGQHRRTGTRTRADSVWTWVVGILIVGAIVLGFRAIAAERGGAAAEPRAVVIDQLSPQYSNAAFRSTTTASFQAFGLTVDVFEGEQVDVGLYRSLASRQPGVVLIRSHSGILVLEAEKEEHVTALFTNEPYSSTSHVSEQLNDRLLIVRPFEDDAELTFGVSPRFITGSMNGRLPRSIVIIAGCSCLGRTDLAEAFVSRGASVVVSWDGSVSLEHVDAATAFLVDRLFLDRLTLEESVIATMLEYGQDPDFGALMSYFPVAAGRYTASELMGLPD
ncbi:MAG: hypothetical protein M0R22_13385 [Dehalococcoidia bacterium]|jgi:hypothetical protein|nr:hypothetical protein [Dehalococcoidia bacterium]